MRLFKKNSFDPKEVNTKSVKLYELPIGRTGKVELLLNEGISRRRLLDLGLIPGSKVVAERVSPSGNPIAFNIRGAVIALRREESANVIIELL